MNIIKKITKLVHKECGGNPKWKDMYYSSPKGRYKDEVEVICDKCGQVLNSKKQVKRVLKTRS